LGVLPLAPGVPEVRFAALPEVFVSCWRELIHSKGASTAATTPSAGQHTQLPARSRS
jgi:hypothetical protein